MFRRSVGLAVTCAVAGALLAGCDEGSDEGAQGPESAVQSTGDQAAGGDAANGATKITIEGKQVNVSCSGTAADGKPVIILLPGLGDDVTKLEGIQKPLSEKNRVCSYDRLGEGASDQPDGPQTYESAGKILTGVIDQVAGNSPVVLAGHSLGGAIAARYTPDHTDKVKGLVLMDATPPTLIADVKNVIPESATGPAAEIRGQLVAVNEGQNPELLTAPDGDVRSAGDIPVEVIQHGQPYLAAAVPDYGEQLEQVWSEGQRKWLGLSSRSNLTTAQNADHYIYVGEPNLAIQTIERVVAEASA